MPCVPRALLLAFAILAYSTVSTSAYAQEKGFETRNFTCPIGAGKFSQDVGYSSLGIVQFADGSWLGDASVDAQIPQCPDNGLVLIPDYPKVAESNKLEYLAFSPEQMARLPALIASPEYRAMASKGRHERAFWLATQLQLPAATRLELLRRSTWAAMDPSERKRLVALLAQESPALIEGLATEEGKRNARFYQANALRELGRFDEAEGLAASLVKSLPEDAEVKDPDAARAFMSTLGELLDAIGYRDDDRFPVDLSSEKWVARVCSGQPQIPPYGEQTNNAKAACARREQQRKALNDAFAEAERLKKDPATLAASCAQTPKAKRSQALHIACFDIENERDEEAGKKLLQDPRKLAADCEATPDRDRSGELSHACREYRSALEIELTTLLASDRKAYDIICGGKEPPDRAVYAYQPCAFVERGSDGFADDAPLPDDADAVTDDPEVAMRKVARRYAEAIIATAKADNAYPKRRAGDEDF